MLDKEGPEFEKLLETYRIKQKKPLAVPYKRMDGFDIIAKETDAEVWFPIYPMAPEHTLAETVRNTRQVYREILTFRHCGKERGSGNIIRHIR